MKDINQLCDLIRETSFSIHALLMSDNYPVIPCLPRAWRGLSCLKIVELLQELFCEFCAFCGHQ